jgi:hypothetical protein
MSALDSPVPPACTTRKRSLSCDDKTQTKTTVSGALGVGRKKPAQRSTIAHNGADLKLRMLTEQIEPSGPSRQALTRCLGWKTFRRGLRPATRPDPAGWRQEPSGTARSG